MTAPDQCCRNVKKFLPGLFDHLIGKGKQCGWNGATERLSSGQVDDKFEFRGLLYRKVAGLLTSENPINICRRLSKLTDEVWTVGH